VQQTTESVAGQIKRQGSTVFGDYVEGDLDSDSPDWGVSEKAEGKDFRIYAGQMLMYSPAAIGYFGNHSPSYADCLAFTNYGRPDDSYWKAGKSFCLKTTEGRHASLTIRSEPDAAHWSLPAGLVVWKSDRDNP